MALQKEFGDTQDSAAQQLVHLLCAQFAAPCGLISLFGEQKLRLSAAVGLDLKGLVTDVSATRLLVEAGADATLVIGDVSLDPRLQDHPLAKGPAGLRFYAGATIVNRAGQPVGSIAVMDTQARPEGLKDGELFILKRFARLAGDMLRLADLENLMTERLHTLSLAEGMAKVGNWRLDARTGHVTWSDEVYRIHGVDRSTFDPSYEDALNFYHPDDRAEVRAAVDRTLATGEPYEFRLRIRRPDGEERIVLSRGAAERDGRGRALSAFGVFQDVTEAERAQNRLKESEARYRLFADRATDIIATYDMNGVFTYVSPALETLTGVKPEAVVGRQTWDFIHRDDIPAVKAAFDAYIASGGEAPPPRIAYRTRTIDSEWIWLEAHPKLVLDEMGRPLLFQDTVREITQTKVLESELISARDAAQDAARAKSEFLANMSHELRTPLTSVIGFSGLLLDSATLSPADRRHVDRIATASGALLGVINDILDYSKLEADAVELEPRAFDPKKMLHDAAAIIEPQCAAKGVPLDLELEDLPSGVMGDEGRVRQVVLNLLSNAAKFTSAGRVIVSARYDGDSLTVSVKDSGVGIPADKIAGLFERFSQADASTTRLYGGTGLGLAICRRLVEMMGGDIQAQSEVGAGATFEFRAPLPISAVDSTPSTTPSFERDEHIRVLVADDVEANRALVTALLAGLGLSADVACNGAEAVEMARRGDYDLVLMDVQMPVMDGLTATRTLRALGRGFERLPVIALTANVQPEQIERCRQAGMTDHVGKPIQLVELVGAIQTALGGDKRGPPVALAN